MIHKADQVWIWLRVLGTLRVATILELLFLWSFPHTSNLMHAFGVIVFSWSPPLSLLINYIYKLFPFPSALYTQSLLSFTTINISTDLTILIKQKFHLGSIKVEQIPPFWLILISGCLKRSQLCESELPFVGVQVHIIKIQELGIVETLTIFKNLIGNLKGWNWVGLGFLPFELSWKFLWGKWSSVWRNS